MNQGTFQDKVVVVTGAASGIGFAIAQEMANGGAQVIINDIRAEEGQAAADRLRASFIQGDLSDRADCRRLIDGAIAEFGTVHILVNNAGFQHVDPIEVYPEDTWDRMLAVLLTAPFLLTRYAWPSMKAQQWGRVINIGSRLSVRAEPFKSAYTAAKHGLLGLTRTTALEGGPLGITAHVICPAYVRTKLMADQIDDLARVRDISPEAVVEQVMLKQSPIKRLIEPEEIGALVAFLCRPEASAMSGSPVMIDLGSTLL